MNIVYLITISNKKFVSVSILQIPHQSVPHLLFNQRISHEVLCFLAIKQGFSSCPPRLQYFNRCQLAIVSLHPSFLHQVRDMFVPSLALTKFVVG
ncbi:hypothetical protein ES332_D02G215800v1 [Gossypium tomentosum]|uniref:Uncharacterized protein n=1 Tax=Gossypium tomentosum TaxID=34277 RepID=A0A5D2M0C3_GOSTO|nr:hypothetical protein ES332_D02G215800v1 [Gossypium tomentosum]